MKKKKGFTLIELLAVIVILAIIALIATPIILNMISKARKSAAKDSALGYIDAINYNNDMSSMNNDYNLDYTPIGAGQHNVSSVNIKMKGKKPTSGTVTIGSNGKVSALNICIGGYTVTSEDGKDVSVGDRCSGEEQSSTSTTYTPGQLVYFDPVSTNTCDSSHTTGSTCYKWRVISSSGNNLTVQLDHNLVNKCSWSVTPGAGPDNVLSLLAEQTASWTRVDSLNYSYNNSTSTGSYGTLTCTNGSCKITGNDTAIATGVKARLITGEEVKALATSAGAASTSIAGTWTAASDYNNQYYFCNSDYTIGTVTSGTGSTSLNWMVENTDANTHNGAIDNAYGDDNGGYWTLSIVSGTGGQATWAIVNEGRLIVNSIGVPTSFGARPVITMAKSNFAS